jgi:4-amino-4-deoxy-L-arabinose transferase
MQEIIHQYTFETTTIVLCLLLSIFLRYKSSKISLTLLILSIATLGYLYASIDPFLNLWDEQFHALVAKNLIDSPLKPILIKEPIIPIENGTWVSTHIWLHKQPLFLWQIALSIKLYGTNAIAVRLPSVIMHTIIPIFIYRIGSIIKNKEIGYYGAMLFGFAFFPLALAAGKFSTDHNDIAFLFYVTGSLWSLLEYYKTNNKYWIILIGLFSGCAVLVKWIMGFLVYITWAMIKFFEDKKGIFKIKSHTHIVTSLFISFSIALPWQIYIWLAFPKEAALEYKLMSQHMFHPIENHGESLFFYFTEGLQKLYGGGMLVPISILIVVVLLFLKIKKQTHRVFIHGTIAFVYLFFSLAQTKMATFTIIVSPFIFLAIANLLQVVIHYSIMITQKQLIRMLISTSIIIFAVIAMSDIGRFNQYFTMNFPETKHRSKELLEMKIIENLPNHIGNQKHIILNVSTTPFAYVPMMFFTDHIAYHFIPSQKQYNQLKSSKYDLAIIDNGNLPEYILNDKDITIIPTPADE